MPKVYIVQDPTFYDDARGQYKSKFDFTPAATFGELVYLLPAGTLNEPQEVVAVLRAKLQDFRIGDFLLPTGRPDHIMWAGAIAAEKNDGHLNTLVWEGKTRCYKISRAQLW